MRRRYIPRALEPDLQKAATGGDDQRGDPRPAIEERYATLKEHLEKVAAAARTLADRGYLLDRDVAAQVERAAAEWDCTMGGR